MKKFFKKIIVAILGFQVRRLQRRHSFKTIAVVGSIGKTTTKLMIARLLASEKRVQYQDGNYNDIVSVPLVIFGHTMPALWNIFSWLKIIFLNEIIIWGDYPFDFVVIEVGTDGPSQIEEFRSYLHADIAVITAVTKEHMEFFEDIKAVALEEFSIMLWSDIVFVNNDLCEVWDENIFHQKIRTYGIKNNSQYHAVNIKKMDDGYVFGVEHEGRLKYSLSPKNVTYVQLYSVLVASTIASMCGISKDSIDKILSQNHRVPGRMQILSGIKNSTIIDDSYNASPSAVLLALDVLYDWEASGMRIAVLGMMNELGKYSKSEHEKIGLYCDDKKLSYVVTIGKDANAYTASMARKKGCKVYEAKDTDDAGLFIKSIIEEGSVVLVKGSQNGVFAEESIKPILLNPDDAKLLVRQDSSWLKRKGIMAR